jgi:calcineurin-like phosphoesterase family protein
MNPDNVFFTSDTHFGHHGIIAPCRRPYGSVEEMDAALIRNWNDVVPSNGVVFHLGDVSFKGAARTVEVLGSLNGKIILVRGNHDAHMSAVVRSMFDEVVDYKELKLEGTRICMSHYPMASWNQMHYGSWMLHGHSHGNMPRFGRRIDVGVDCWMGAPVSYRMLKAELSARAIESQDHHQPKETP